MRLHYERQGAGPDVLLVHGWGLHGGIWTDFAAGLMERARVTRVDLPGHGQSEMISSYTLDALADALAELCPTPTIAVGWSLGALAVLALAQRHASRLRGLVLLGATPRFVAAPDWPHAVAPSLLRQFAADLARDYAGTLSRFLTLQLGMGVAERDVLKRLRALVLARELPSAAGLNAGLALLEQTDLRPLLATVKLPVLVIHGDRDRLVPPAAAAHLARSLPAARLYILPQAGHAPFLSHTAECLCETRNFLYA